MRVVSFADQREKSRPPAAPPVAGTTVEFRFKSVVKAGESDWSAPVSLLVK